MEFYAHKKVTEKGIERQLLKDHCNKVAQYASNSMENIGLGQAAYLAGLLHDVGKYKHEFQEYLDDENSTKRRGAVNHTFAGCRILLENFHEDANNPFEKLTAELLAYAIGAHHGQFDLVDNNFNSGFLHRLEKENIFYEESKDNCLRDCISQENIKTLFNQACEEVKVKYSLLRGLIIKNDKPQSSELSFYFALTARMILSAVIDGDRRDTAEFMCDKEEKQYNFSWRNRLEFMESKLLAFPQVTEIARARGRISQQCSDFAQNAPARGIYRLNVPTGAGKTLSSLRFALAHADRHHKKRVIFVTPLLSILEQNAQEIRKYIGQEDIILEHHSNVMHEAASNEQLDLKELATENWHAPVIITTMVQLLNTMFSGKTTAIRRFQALCNSVIVIDEVQTVPNNLLSIFNLTLNYLANVCEATIVLCSATQPCLEKANHPLLGSFNEIVPYDEMLWSVFKRTELKDIGAYRLDALPDVIIDIANGSKSLLVICNKKSEAEFLFSKIKDCNENIFHLSASMCIAHRRQTLEEIREALEKNIQTICISTQVIEAGVDISFQTVIRLTAGMDHIIQAAGRCNRNHESENLEPVYIIDCMDEKLTNLREIEKGKQATQSLLEEFKRQPEMFENDLASDKAIKVYYEKLYRGMKKGFQDNYLKKIDNTTYSLLSDNRKYLEEGYAYYGKFVMNQAFKLAGTSFQVFDENTYDVVVPYGKGKDLIVELSSFDAYVSVERLCDWIERAKPYTISIYDYQKQILKDQIHMIHDICVLSPEAYDDKVGLLLENQNQLDFLTC